MTKRRNRTGRSTVRIKEEIYVQCKRLIMSIKACHKHKGFATSIKVLPLAEGI